MQTHRLWTELGAKGLLQEGDEELMERVADPLEVAAGQDDHLLRVGVQPEGDALHRLLGRGGRQPQLKTSPRRTLTRGSVVKPKNAAHHHRQVSVNDMCKVELAGPVVGFGCHAQVKVPNPDRELLVDFFVLPEDQTRVKCNRLAQYSTLNHTVIK